MTDFYFCLPGGAVRAVKARDLATAAEYMNRRMEPEPVAVYRGEDAWRSAIATALNEGADEPKMLEPLIARGRGWACD